MKYMMIMTLLSLATITTSQSIWEEKDGVVAVEAESFAKKDLVEVRDWYFQNDTTSSIPGDQDSEDLQGYSGDGFLEVLPDTRLTHDDELIHMENFCNEPGRMAILYYPIFFNNPGKYYVWVRTNTSGTEDNGIHVGLDGEWPASGQRMQFDGKKKSWSWESRQRTKEVHTGVEELIYLDIESAGIHVISFSMREDGFAFDKFVCSLQYKAPEGQGPDPIIYHE